MIIQKIINIVVFSIFLNSSFNIKAQSNILGKFENGVFEDNNYKTKLAPSKLKYYKMQTLLKALKSDSLLHNYTQALINSGVYGYGSSLVIFNFKNGRVNLIKSDTTTIWDMDKALIFVIEKYMRKHQILNQLKSKSYKYGIFLNFNNDDRKLCLELYEIKKTGCSIIKIDCIEQYVPEPNIPVKKIEDDGN